MGAGGNEHRKVAIKVVDADMIEVSGIAIQRWTGNGSIGLQLQGREFGFFENMSVRADLPVSIEKNPYRTGSASTCSRSRICGCSWRTPTVPP